MEYPCGMGNEAIAAYKDLFSFEEKISKKARAVERDSTAMVIMPYDEIRKKVKEVVGKISGEFDDELPTRVSELERRIIVSLAKLEHTFTRR